MRNGVSARQRSIEVVTERVVQERRPRSTGTLVRVVDRRDDPDFMAESVFGLSPERWVTVCVDQDSERTTPRRSDAVEIATPDDARSILELKGADKVAF